MKFLSISKKFLVLFLFKSFLFQSCIHDNSKVLYSRQMNDESNHNFFHYKTEFSVELESSNILRDCEIDILGNVSWNNQSNLIKNEKAEITAVYDTEEVTVSLDAYSKLKNKPYEVKEYPILLSFKRKPLAISLILKLSANGNFAIKVDSGIYNGHLFTGEKLKVTNQLKENREI